jgi:hypothetical protein
MMTDEKIVKLYHPKHRSTREAPAGSTRLAQLKRAGYKVGELPPLPKPVQESPKKMPVTAVDETEEQEEKKEPVMAEHAPVIEVEESAEDESVEEESDELEAEEETGEDEEAKEEAEAEEVADEKSE